MLKLTPSHLQPHRSLRSTCARHIVVSPYLLTATSGSSEFWGRPEENPELKPESSSVCRPAHQACGSFCVSPICMLHHVSLCCIQAGAPCSALLGTAILFDWPLRFCLGNDSPFPPPVEGGKVAAVAACSPLERSRVCAQWQQLAASSGTTAGAHRLYMQAL